jgi:hypothetical protein
MIIEQTANNNVVIKGDDGNILQIIATDVFIQKHPRNEDCVILSKTSSNQDEKEGIQIYASKVTQVNGKSFSGSLNDLMVALEELFKKGGGSGSAQQVLDSLNYPFVNTGFGFVTKGNNPFKQHAKHIVGNGINDCRVVRKVPVNGTDEYWVAGAYMNIIRYDENLNLLDTIPIYSTMYKTNNYAQYTQDMFIDFTEDKLYMCCLNRHVVRVYQFSTLRDGGFVPGNAKTGGHLYDIGIENPSNSYWDISQNNTKHAGLGYLYNPYAVTKNPITGNIIIVNGNGYAETQTSNIGFVAEYSKDTGAFQRTIIQYNGTNAYGGYVNTNQRYMRSALVIGTTLFIGVDTYHIHKYDLSNISGGFFRQSNYPNNYDTSNFRFRVLGLEEDNGNLLICNDTHSSSYDKNGLLKTDLNFNVLGQIGNIKGITDNNNPYRVQDAWHAINVGDRGLGVGDWFIICNNDYLELVCMGNVSDGSKLPQYTTFYEIDASTNVPVPEGWMIKDFINSESYYDDENGRLLLPIQELYNTDNILITTEKQ